MPIRSVIATGLAVLSVGLAACGTRDSTEGDPVAVTTSGSAPTATTAAAPAVTPTGGPARSTTSTDLAAKPVVKAPGGAAPAKLEVSDIVVGRGPAAKAGEQLTVQYVGALYKNGKQFDSSWDKKQPFPFTLGQQMVIPGWDQGIPGMRAGGRRELIIPAALAYGASGSPPDIGPNEPLVFVVDLKKIG